MPFTIPVDPHFTRHLPRPGMTRRTAPQRAPSPRRRVSSPDAARPSCGHPGASPIANARWLQARSGSLVREETTARLYPDEAVRSVSCFSTRHPRLEGSKRGWSW